MPNFADLPSTHLADALAVAVAADVPVLLWGPPGVGKSATVAATAAADGRHLETVIASLHEPVDFSGLPIAQGDGSVRFAEPAWARRLGTAPRALLFLDEISLAAPAVQAALLRVVLDRRVGEYDLGPHVAVVAAANPVEQATGAFELSAPLANRFCHLDWHLDADTVVTGFSGRWPTVRPALVPDDWRQGQVEARARVGAFLDRRRELIHVLPEDSYDLRGWPSPRSWEAVADVLAACAAAGVHDAVRLLLVSGLVGHGPAIEFLTWQERADLPATADVLGDPDGVALPSTSDGLWAVVGAVCAVAAERPQEHWDAAMAVCLRVAAIREDLAARGMYLLAACRPAQATPPAGVGVLREVLTLAGPGRVA